MYKKGIPMGFDSIIHELIQKYNSYRSETAWQYCGCRAATLEALGKQNAEWQEQKAPFDCQGKKDFWFKSRYTVPGEIMGIDIRGSLVRLNCVMLEPLEVYINGKRVFRERFWSDFKIPEVVLTPNAVPGESMEVHIHLMNRPGLDKDSHRWVGFSVDAEILDDMIFELETFLEEMAFCSRFEEIKDIYEKAVKYAGEKIVPGADIARALEIINEIRAILAPAADYTKKYTVHLVGHAHIDMNWLWDMKDTIHVCKRDFTTLTKMMEEIPEFRFSQSQVSVYDITEKNFPQIFKKVQKCVKAGSWDVTAATWTEADLNMSNGESIVRHILYAREYTKEKFGTCSRVFWEPDTFGHPANMPQIVKKSGIDYYYHMRTGEENRQAFHNENPLYIWEGMDGSQLLVFTSCYGGEVRAANIIHISSYLRNRHGLLDALFVYGVGDHGGGPTRRDIKRAQRMNLLPTLPRIIFSTTHDFFDAVKSQNPLNLETYKGEMNPVFDGCYTSHGDIKYYNRTCENRFLEAETAGALSLSMKKPYPGDILAGCWKTLMFNQFHDILDGCAIHSTYELADKQLEEVLQKSKDIIGNNLEGMSAQINIKRTGKAIAIWNLQGFARTDVVSLEKNNLPQNFQILDCEQKSVDFQVVEDAVYFIAEDVPSLGYKVYYIVDSPNPAKQPESRIVREDDHRIHLSNDYLDIQIDKRSGCILEMFDKECQTHIIHGRSWYDKRTFFNNLFKLYHETPVGGMSAWVIGAITGVNNLIKDAKVTVKSSGDLMDVIHIENKINERSSLSQDMFFYRKKRRIDFKTCVNWQEASRNDRDYPMLKVSFTPILKGKSRVTYDIPFGNVERVSDGVDYPALKWVDVSDSNYGFSLLNDCKYGFNANGNTIEMTCLRASTAPDPVPDKREHSFNYSLYPHKGSWKKAHTVQEASSLNSPLNVVYPKPQSSSSLLPEKHSFLSVEGEGVHLSCFKKALEDDAIVIRLYEYKGEETSFTVRFSMDVKRVVETSLSEDQVCGIIEMKDRSFTDHIKKYEIKTYKIYQ
jgi:alpha-mannosidase